MPDKPNDKSQNKRPASEITKPQSGPDNLIRTPSGKALLEQRHHEQSSYREISIYNGPLPDPETLRQYEEILPGIAERFMNVVEMETRHRHELDMRDAERNDSIERRASFGTKSALVISITSFGLSAFAFWLNHPVEAATLATGTIGALAGAFIYGTNAQKSNDKATDDKDE